MKTRVLVGVSLLMVLLVGAGLLILQPPPPMELPERGAQFEGVVLIVPGAGRTGPVDLVVEGNRIARLSPSASDNVTGYLLPGLSDAHMHGPLLPLPGHEELFAFLYLYHGVTLVRMAAGDNAMRNDIAAGVYPGPRVLSCGPFLDGDPPQWRGSLVVTDAESARDAVEEVVAQGFDCIKVYNELTGEASRAIHESASAAGLPVIGHVPWRQSFGDAHIDDLQHAVGWAPRHPDDADTAYVLRLRRLDKLDDARIEELVAAATGRSLRLTPTLVTLHRKFSLEDAAALRERDSAEMLPRFYRDQLWHPEEGLVSSRLLNASDHARFREAFQRVLEAVDTLHEAGVEIHAGTDAPAEFIVPGAGLIEELHLLEQAGLSPEEVLQVATVLTPRRLLGEDAAPLAEGSLASFVIYSRDPTLSLDNLDSLTGVVADGRYYTRTQLEEQLQRYRDWFDAPLYRLVTETVVGAGLWLINSLSTLAGRG